MYNEQIFNIVLWVFIAFAPCILLLLLTTKYVAPYGKFLSNAWGSFKLPSRLGWILMEVPSVIIFTTVFCLSPNKNTGTIALYIIWLFHYVYRSLVFPFITKSKNEMPIMLMFSAMSFQLVNTYLQAGYVLIINPEFFAGDFLTSWQFILGLVVFLIGSFINRQADYILRNLRKGKPSQTEYYIPQGSLYKYISCPNHFGEMIIWLGWAIMLQSWVGFAFFIWTIANLLPRARTSHKWYKEKFADYPKERKALIPFIF